MDNELISEIGRGLFCLIGITHEDKKSDAEQLAKKIVSIRVFEDQDGKPWSTSVKQLLDGQILSVVSLAWVAKKTFFSNTATSEPVHTIGQDTQGHKA